MRKKSIKSETKKSEVHLPTTHTAHVLIVEHTNSLKPLPALLISFIMTLIVVVGAFFFSKKQMGSLHISLPHVALPAVPFIAAKQSYAENMSYQFIDPVLFADYVKKNTHEYALVDIRSSTEFAAGHIPTAINIPAYRDSDAVYETLLDKNQWVWQLAQKVGRVKQVIVYGYLPQADVTLDYAGYAKKYATVKILAVGWTEWASTFSRLMPSDSNPSGGVVPLAPIPK
jgi:rhodanese-related sulfurtransferase